LELARRIKVSIDVADVEPLLRELTVHYTIPRYPNAANAEPYELYDEQKARG